MRKVVVITGASDGIGKALVKLLNDEYDLAICGRNVDKMNNLIKDLDLSHVYYECFDIVDGKKREEFVKNVLDRYHRIDVLVNNAGANTKKDKVVDINIEDLRYMFELNCVSSLDMIQKFYPTMSKQQSGLIMNVLSTCCLFNNPMAGSYSATKDAMEGISKILLKEVKNENIGVCNVYPGGTDTAFRAIANHNYLKPETVAKMMKACIENEEGCVHDIVIRPHIEDNIA